MHVIFEPVDFIAKLAALVVGRKNSIGVVKLPIGTHDAARRGPVFSIPL